MKPGPYYLIWALCLFLLSYGLGKARLFEPDEGRNAEIAREVLVTGDWVTPHHDFLPALDKPMAFFWLVAVAYKVFGLSEGAARLPSLLASLGCLALIFRFCRKAFGIVPALWTLVILVTSLEFFLLSRIVIFDMALTFCITLALFSFYEAAQAADQRSRRQRCLIMYAAMAVGSLIKGPIALVIPMMVIGAYLLINRKLSLLLRLSPLAGALIFFVIVTPWYALVESRNPGYLKYFLWEEHFLRFLTPHFGRTEPWYYFFWVLPVGFSPWSIALPMVLYDLRQQRRDDANLFLILWAVLPFCFFSFSSSKLPHYILPVFPPLAILTGRFLNHRVSAPNARSSWLWPALWLCEFLPLCYFAVGAIWPELLPVPVRPVILEAKWTLWVFMCGVFAALAATLMIAARRNPIRFNRIVPRFVFMTIMLVPIVIVHITAPASGFRSAKVLADKSLPLLTSTDQLVLYDIYLGGLLFYLQVSQPVWLVWSGNKSNIMGSWYVAENQPAPLRGKVLFTFEEFDEVWRTPKRRLLVYVKESNLEHFLAQSPVPPAMLSKVGNFVLLTYG
jgi:4-amino-4-deoxy-L-arabinose transferase-like glycosyltransferase